MEEVVNNWASVLGDYPKEIIRVNIQTKIRYKFKQPTKGENQKVKGGGWHELKIEIGIWGGKSGEWIEW